MRPENPNIESTRLSDYQYELPEGRIAQHPLAERDQSKLLIYRGGEIAHHTFFEIPAQLPGDTLLVFNDTRVIQARLYFRRETGALIEIFLLHPHQPSEVNQAMQVNGSCSWSCVIGRKKRWKDGEVLSQTFQMEGREATIHAELTDREANIVRFSWEPENIPFADLLPALGELPLPPYIHRAAQKEDEEQYQTVYARSKGAVAAPTAGLHFTDEVLENLQKTGIRTAFVTLHVSAGTFLPVKHDKVVDHDMHSEQMIVTPALLEQLLTHEGNIIPVGTTSMRVLESLYWLGTQVLHNQYTTDSIRPFSIEKLEPYNQALPLPSQKESLAAILTYLNHCGMASWTGETQIFIIPGYEFKLCNGLMTNFHMPGTTLMLLVAALIGEDWRKVYQAGLENDYRFLSYGDTSLLLPTFTSRN